MTRYRRYAPWLFMLLGTIVVLLLAASAHAQEPPDRRGVVEQLAQDTGTLIQTDSTTFTDRACALLALEDPAWGRKARRAGDWASRNADVVAYRWPSGAWVYVDIVGASDSPQARPAWQVVQPVDGAWMACPAAAPPSEPEPQPPGSDQAAVLAAVADLRAQLATMQAALEELRARPLPACPAPTIEWPTYEGTVRVPFLGSAPVTLSPTGARR